MTNLFIILLFIFIILNCYFYETFQNYINPFYKNKSFCTFNINKNKCACTYQKDGINIPFNTIEKSCNNTCINKTKENCNNNIINKDINYYCKYGSICKKYNATIQNRYISNNNCGFDKLTNQLMLPYLDKKTCESSINNCDKYNSGKKGQKELCLNNTNCGYCTNKYGIGKCIEGTASGPLDIQSNCSNNSKNNKYEYHNILF